MTTKMKGLLKGLRYISQIFDDDEKEPEMNIGYPTDVKHVAHIGWDGPSEKNSPSWMTDFKPSSPRQSSSAPLGVGNDEKDGSSFNGVYEESSRGIVGTQSYKSSPAPELPEIPKSSRSHNPSLSSGDAESPTKAKSDKHRPPRRSSKGSHNEREVSDSSKPTQQSMDSAADAVPSQLSDLPKKSRKKKPKDSGASTRSSSRSSKPQVKDSCSSPARENESLSTGRNKREGSQRSNAVDEADGIGHGLVS
ncbi:CRIB domain-containing protein RIC7-like [Rhodamnia argentea]|uniref:CRIB domain-containing protein RIC7-like n=1 Tax=Rhodamnia argentea TaxID=178133 RepID=A0A8B8R2B5_9MYRT|nr:CRIB domain-containing protein RIC7-like [Rhodamnia argentea]